MKSNPWVTPGYEHLELTTQRVIAAALDRQIKVEVLDAASAWIRLSQDGHTEIIRQGNETRADSYVTSLILGDKAIQKRLMAEAGVSVPHGKKYDDITSAKADFSQYTSGRWVVKPTTTNYGVGITMLPVDVSEEAYLAALELAFSQDQSVIVETFVSGIECRFLVIGDQCRAILHRRPANVLGDGTHTITELVDEKNKDPRRGKGYKTPLETITLGEVERGVLAKQNLTVDSIPADEQRVCLRQNSNISTGGDSLDYTDLVHPGYAQVAVQACQTVEAQICGVDMMLSDFTAPPNVDNHAIIELNYNPVLYFHDFPYEGENRNVAPHILDLLGFE